MTSLLSLSTLVLAFVGLFVLSGADFAHLNQKPTIILVPAAFSKATVYDLVKGKLLNVGYDVVAVDLPSVGSNAGRIDRTADIMVVQKALGRQVHQGRKVIVVGNSYGCTVICDALKDFESQSSLKNPAHGNITGAIFFSGFIPYMTEITSGHPDIRNNSPSWFRFEGTSRVFWDNDLHGYPPSVTLYNLLPLYKADAHGADLQPSSFAALNATARYIPYDGKFRSLYIVGSHDNAVPPALAQTYLDQPGAKWESEMIDGDHSPMLSRPDKFVEIVRRFAGEKV